MRIFTLGAAVLVAACSASTPSEAPAAQNQAGNAAAGASAGKMVSAKRPQTLVDALQAGGYQAQLGTTADEPSITSGAGGHKFSIFFENCTDGKDCTTVSFFTGFTDLKSTPERLNEWNRTNRFARAFIDSEGDPVLRMDVDLDHDGIAAANFNEYLQIWASLAPKYVNFIREK